MSIALSLPKTTAEREQRLVLAREELKNKFIGIDEQIDSIIDRITYWYLRQDKPRRPAIINLWGTTGVGKTDLIRDLKNILGFNDRYSEIMLSDNEGEHLIVDHIYENCPEMADGLTGFIVLDEFQRYKTKESNGEAKRGMGYKDVWQILSDGIILKNLSRYSLTGMFSTFGWYPNTGFDGLDADGDSIEEAELKKTVLKSKTAQARWGSNGSVTSVFRYRDISGSLLMNSYYAVHPDRLMDLKKDFQDASRLLQYRGITTDGTVEGVLEGIASLLEENPGEQFTLSHDFSSTVIFVIGNLDDVYKNALKTDSSFVPANYYREWSKSISIFDIKASLKDLFFPEQVARLGNTHIIYPTLGEEHYRELIIRGMNSVIEDVVQGGYKVRLRDSMVELVYRNAVYPTQGVRPVFSTLQDVSNAVMLALQSMGSHPKDQVYVLDYDRRNKSIEVRSEQEWTLVVSFKFIGDRDKELEKMYANPEASLNFSIHEIGHALISYARIGRVPLFCVLTDNGAQTVDSHHLANTFEFQWGNVIASMGGIAATHVLKGKAYICGHTRDLDDATSALVGMLRTYGFGDLLLKTVSPVRYRVSNLISSLRPLSCQYTVLGDKTAESHEVILFNNTDSYLVDKALRKATQEALHIVRTYKDVVYKLALELSENQFISQDRLQEEFNKAGVPQGTPATFIQQED